MDALLAHQLPEVEDEAAQPGEPVAGVGVRGALGRAAEMGRRRVSAQHGDQAGEIASARMEGVGVDARRDDVHPVVEARPEQLLGHLDDVTRAGEERARPRERGDGQRRQLRTAADGVLQLGAVDLDRVGGAVGAGPRRDGAAHEDVVCQHEVGPAVVGRRHRSGVPVDEQLELGRGHVGDVARLDPLVAVEDEGRKQRPHVGPYDADVRAEVEPLRPRFLAHHDDVVPQPPPRPCHVLRVDVRAGALEQVAVPQDEPHRHNLPARPAGRMQLGQVEVERVQDLDDRARAVHGDVGRRVDERVGVVEDDLHAGPHEPVGSLLGRLLGNGEDAHDHVAVADGTRQLPPCPGRARRPNPLTDLGRVRCRRPPRC